jgi:Tol biopolymer transport system component
VDWPDWSPDGTTIAFAASTAAIGLSDPSRLDQPFSIWTLDLQSSSTHAILSGVVEPRSLRWSPDGASLAFAGTVSGRPGTWILTPATGSVRLINPSVLAWLAWSPNGSELVGVQPVSSDLSELVTVSVD